MNYNNTIKITIKGNPKGKPSSRKGKYGNWYNPASGLMNINKKIIKDSLPKTHGSFKFPIPKNIPVILSMNFFIAPNKKEQTKKFIEKIKNDDYPYFKKPDLDNLIKLIKDCMSKIVYNDDNQVYRYNKVARYYSLNPRTEIELTWPEVCDD
jgi:Holliday junction resolvase RusA-like endonuclease